VRRAVVVLTLVVVAATPHAPARAHVCSDGTVVGVDQPATVSIGIPAEDKAVTAVEVEVVSPFELTSVDPVPGWSVARDGRSIAYRGGRVDPFACAYLVVRGRVRRPATFALPLVLHYEDGSQRAFRSSHLGDADLGQMIFAVTRTAAPPRPSRPGPGVGAGTAVALTAVVVLVARTVSRRGKRVLSEK
jgi:hypothetical protein